MPQCKDRGSHPQHQLGAGSRKRRRGARQSTHSPSERAAIAKQLPENVQLNTIFLTPHLTVPHADHGQSVLPPVCLIHPPLSSSAASSLPTPASSLLPPPLCPRIQASYTTARMVYSSVLRAGSPQPPITSSPTLSASAAPH